MRKLATEATGFLRGFLRSEDGLVTVEWVALAGALVIGSITVGWLMMNGLAVPAQNVDAAISSCASTAAANSGTTTSCTVP
ncbi:MAG: hypothetical protein BGN85_05655 [Alphaproteobacteria bacterium 64-11]|nr:hypothetical protein [Alphaproteobacteria bacterium]OJU10401.1 MAG: hypothetical protein BGN85_05655 [Alphaproteobacteria bacterium 64-11]